jgi:hypothetical protein
MWEVMKYMWKVGKRQQYDKNFKSMFPVITSYDRLYEEGFHRELTREQKKELKENGIPLIAAFDPDWRPKDDMLRVAYQKALGVIEDENPAEIAIENTGTRRDPDNLWEGYELGSDPVIFVYKFINDPQVIVRVKFTTSIGVYYKWV